MTSRKNGSIVTKELKTIDYKLIDKKNNKNYRTIETIDYSSRVDYSIYSIYRSRYLYRQFFEK